MIAAIGAFTACAPETFNNYCSVSGIVLEEGTNEPLQGVTVTLKGVEQRNETTGSDGTFLFEDIDANLSTKLDIWAQKSGYETNHVNIGAIAGETLSVTIQLKKLNN